jgi:hypothetical protein
VAKIADSRDCMNEAIALGKVMGAAEASKQLGIDVPTPVI